MITYDSSRKLMTSLTYDDLSQVVISETFFVFFFFLNTCFFRLEKFWKMTLWKTCPRISREQHVPDSPLDDMEIEKMNQLLPGSIGLSSLYASITYDWHVSGATTECFWLCPSQATDRHKDGQRHTYGRTDVNQETQRDAHKERNRDKRQKTTDENQETVQETRTVVRHGVHCDACCCDGGWVVVRWSCCVVVLLVLCACVSPVGAFWVVAASLLLPWRWRFALSSLEVAAILLLRWPRHQGARDTTMRPRHQGCPRDRWQALGKMGQDLCVQFKSLLQLILTFHLEHYFK